MNTMQVELEALQPELKKATVETDRLLVIINADTIVANEQSVIVGTVVLVHKHAEAFTHSHDLLRKSSSLLGIEADKCNIQAAEAKALKESCEADLAEGNFLLIYI